MHDAKADTRDFQANANVAGGWDTISTTKLPPSYFGGGCEVMKAPAMTGNGARLTIATRVEHNDVLSDTPES